MALRNGLAISAGIRAALHDRRPIVALESTIITHGLPRPTNFETAVAVEDAVRCAGAEPATIALLDGVAHIGLTQEQLERVADSKTDVVKASRANLAQTLAKGKGFIGGTTVSGTMALAHLAGIDVFATGGIGGVHRNAESSMDISADLTELGRTPVAVFSSGAKSILDIPRTLEYLETQGVPVMTLNPSGEFPCFYTRFSGQFVPSVPNVQEAARIIAHNRFLGLQNGLLFGVPIPEEYEHEGAEIQQAVEIAIRESVKLGIDRRGKEVTPWLLQRVAQLAKQSIQSNIALVINNAKVAAECAVHLRTITSNTSLNTPQHMTGEHQHEPCAVLVVGCAAVDVTSQCTTKAVMESTATGRVALSVGGVSHNVAYAAHLLSSRPSGVVLAAPMNAYDAHGIFLQNEIKHKDLQIDNTLVAKDAPTPVCNLLLDQKGNLVTGVADMSTVELILSPQRVAKLFFRHFSPNLKAVAADANMKADSLLELTRLCANHKVPMLYEPTSIAKAGRLVDALLGQKCRVHTITPNALELSHMAEIMRSKGFAPRTNLPTLEVQFSDNLQKVLEDASVVLELASALFIKLGKSGVLCIWKEASGANLNPEASIYYAPAHKLDPSLPTNTTGAGDTFTGAILAGMRKLNNTTWTKKDVIRLVTVAQAASVRTLYSNKAVSPTLSSLPSVA
ncbi:hypothetical protein MPSI1_002638 [Malassezia psittaci]|uniref:Carbohydrate kinase PfkB domain-containing protein n=1 Tax=Malassezia psittaci TaxID=1821823 RepID=A0AAF0FG22_9BASI|nr:hypothetical protein MPSI1_002638 [Malassezia psittaci]